MPSSTEAPSTVFRLRVTLVDSDPTIWRELEVQADLSLADVHDVLQVAFGWRQSHLHQFTDRDPLTPRPELPRIGRQPRTWAPGPLDGDDSDQESLPENEWSLAQVFDEFDGPLFYEYDFGDGWTHLIELVERIQRTHRGAPAVLLGGERRGPLEDSGGVHGYAEKLGVLANSQHPEHQEISDSVAWVSGPWVPFDPDMIDVDHVNSELAARSDRRLGMSGLAPDAFPGQPKPAEHSAGSGNAIGLLPEDAAIIDLIERLPVPLRIELHALLRRSDALRPLEVGADVAAGMVEPFLWLVRRAGATGTRLTQAGWLPPAVVSDAMHELGWTDRWIGKANREDQTPPIAMLREEAIRIGLLRKRNGVLLATASARNYLDDPAALWRMLADTILPRTRSDIERDIATLVALDIATGSGLEENIPYNYDMTGILYGLGALGWTDAYGGRLDRNAIAALVFDAVGRLESLGVFTMNRWQRTGVTEGGRAFARAILRSPVQ